MAVLTCTLAHVFYRDWNNVVSLDGSILSRGIFRCIHKVLVNRIEFEQGRQKRLTEYLWVSDKVFCIDWSWRNKKPPSGVKELNGAFASLPQKSKYDPWAHNFNWNVFKVAPDAFSVQSSQRINSVFFIWWNRRESLDSTVSSYFGIFFAQSLVCPCINVSKFNDIDRTSFLFYLFLFFWSKILLRL